MGMASVDLATNNVRATLQVAGDLWWDGNDGQYIVPKIEPGSGYEEVSALFASGVWLGGLDPAGNLKVAAQTYGRSWYNNSDQRTDFFPGPLTNYGQIEPDTCQKWDRMFKVQGDSIRMHLDNYYQASKAGQAYHPASIPLAVKGWPARGNPYFRELYGFDLPDKIQGLAAFHDTNGNGDYEPQLGDYPIIKIRGCDTPTYPDEMVFWIFNDAGGTHTQSGGDAIQMEIHATAFAYNTLDEHNNNTYLHYKLINRAIESIDSMYFGFWSDPDLGCYTDDYIGCDIESGLAYIYNEDALDGEQDCDDCPQSVTTYCETIPILGIDFMRGPLNEYGGEIGMEVFTYYTSGGGCNWSPQMFPTHPQDYYNYLSGSWLDGTPFTYGGTGYNPGSTDYVKHAFSSPPNDPAGWSMCSEGLPFGDRRMVQSAGPFRLDPGAVNEMILGLVWVPDLDYPCPDITPLLEADHYAQKLFDNCFHITPGPDAPDIDVVELDQEVVLVLTNNPSWSNNAFEAYREYNICTPDFFPDEDKYFHFEGYKIYQLKDDSSRDIDDPDQARLVYQADIKNGIGQIFNWEATPFPNDNPFKAQVDWSPVLKVDGADEGIRHTISITDDAFAEGPDKRLINHRKYYYTAIAYAYNNYKEFEQHPSGRVSGQRSPYLESYRYRRVYTAIPRPAVYEQLHARYGDGPVITRIAGKGNGGQELDISDAMREQIFEGLDEGTITYKSGYGPLDIKVYNPLAVENTTFELRLEDEDMSNHQLDSLVYWRLTEIGIGGEQWQSYTTIDQINEQLIPEYGFSINMHQVPEPGQPNIDPTNGTQSATLTYKVAEAPHWFAAIQDADVLPLNEQVFDFIRNGDLIDGAIDPFKMLSTLGDGFFTPYSLINYRSGVAAYITPAWLNSFSEIIRVRNPISHLNNVDIVLTPDKSKWSRCVIVETATPFYYDANIGLGIPTDGNTEQFDLRAAPSVSKEDIDGDGLPDPDGDGIGMGWFPGYAVDIETGKRLNIFFGENSTYNGSIDGGLYHSEPQAGRQIGNDMLWNPTSQKWLRPGGSLYDAIAGGQQHIYVTRQAYDGCAFIRNKLAGNNFQKIRGVELITWTAIPLLQPGTQLLSYADGLIPNELVIKLRVASKYQTTDSLEINNAYPIYQFSFDGMAPEHATTPKEKEDALAAVNVFPNPYYGISAYTDSDYSNSIKITNLPAKCTVTIYTLNGTFIRHFKRDEAPLSQLGRTNPGILEKQFAPDVEWDLLNYDGTQVASGVYLIHVVAPDLGERVLKWFGKIN